MISRSTAEKALREIKRTADYEFFYRELTSPDWIAPLDELEQFSRPTEPQQEGDYIKFPPWPPASYLQRMAALAPAAVRDVILRVPEVGNPRIHVDFIEAALAMPADIAASLVPKVTQWVTSEYQLFLVPEKVGQLITKLATQGRAEVALTLARALLALRPDPRTSLDKHPALPARAIAFYDDYQYREILKNQVPSLVQSCGMAAFDLLCDVMEDAVRISTPPAAASARAVDFLHVWRPAIEDHEQNTDFGEPEALVSAVRDAALMLLDRDQASLRDLVEKLESRSWPVFQRIGLHVLRQRLQAGADLIRERVLDARRIADVYLFHEFWLLVRDFFPQLAEAERNRLKALIDHEAKEYAGRRTDLDVEGRMAAEAHWKLRPLAILERVMPAAWKEEYRVLCERYPRPDHPEFLSYTSGSWVGPTSPKSADELKAMPFDEIVAFLRTWKPSGVRFESSADGLGRTLGGLVAEDPARFADAAEQFVGLDPAYVRGLLGGFREARRAKRPFPWGRVLALCQWVVQQPRAIPGYTGEYSDLDPGWVWTRKAIADLLSAGLENGECALPIGARNDVWEILESLCSDPEPTPADEARLGGPNMDPVTLSINTTRGETMHALVRYALWVARARPACESTSSFDDMPEARRVLEEHLDPAIDPSQAIRSVYGMWLPSLAALDEGWLRKNLHCIFPVAEEHEPLRSSAWDAYAVWAGVYDRLFHLTRTAYHRAIDRLPASAVRRSLYSADEHLAQHLMVVYWRSQLNLGDEDALLETFFSRAPVELRAHALDFIGRNLEATEGAVPVDVTERLKRLWLWRREVLASQPKEQSSAELASFGGWFSSGKLDPAWALGQLIDVLGIGCHIEGTHAVVERLAELVEAHTRDCLIALLLIVKADRRWGVGLWKEAAEHILRFGLSHSDPELRQLARDAVNLLLAAGKRDLQHLLREASGESADAAQ